MAEQYKHLTPKDFDKFDCVKLSKWYFIALLFLLRGYLIWVLSVSNMQDTASVITVIYPQPAIFYVHLVAGFPAIFLLILMSLRRPDAANWVQQLWPRSRQILIGLLLFDLVFSLIGYWYIDEFNWLVTLSQILFTSLLIVQVKSSERIAINLSEFPEPVPEK